MVFEPLFCSASAWISVHDHFAVHLFEGRLTLDEMDRMQRVGERWSARHPGKRAELVVVFPSDARMTSEERSRMARLMKQDESKRAASATVILANGILASVQRSMLTGLLLLARPPQPARIFGAVTDALTWLFPYVHETCGANLAFDEVNRTLHEHLAAFSARPDKAA